MELDALALVTEGLTKRFGPRTVVDRLNLAIPTGAVCGFVGPNGAGKTTTIRMLLGLIAPSEGGGRVLGGDLHEPSSYLGRVGALIESPAFYPQLSGVDNLLALARLGRITETVIATVLERVGLAARGDERFGRYSLGMKQRLGIAAALLASPTLLILDEPSNGLDPAGMVEIRGLARSLADEGLTVFVSSHLLSEVEHICDHVVMIRSGACVFQGPVEKLRAGYEPDLVIRPGDFGLLTTLAGIVERTGFEAVIEEASGSVIVPGGAGAAGILNRAALKGDVTIVHLSERRRSLEEAYFSLTGTHSGDAEDHVTLGPVS